jgi:hypothetical protein
MATATDSAEAVIAFGEINLSLVAILELSSSASKSARVGPLSASILCLESVVVAFSEGPATAANRGSFDLNWRES